MMIGAGKPAMASPAVGRSASPIVVNASVNYTENGGTSDDFVKTAREHGRELAKVIKEILEREARVKY